MFVLFGKSNSNTVQLSSSNIQEILQGHELVFVNFYADWCRFSQMLTPVFAEAATKVKEEFPEEGRVAFGRVDCDRETSIASQYHVNKYPTLKMFRFGNLVKKEYRGQRSVEAMGNFIRDQLKSAVDPLTSLEDVESLDPKKRHLILYLDSEESPDYATFKKLALSIREDCKCHVLVGENSQSQRINGNKITFKATGEESTEIGYMEQISNYDELFKWSQDKCVPLVREITFENAEELTEEGLPFLILFHNIEDTETTEAFKRIVAKELVAEKSSVNFLTADGVKFSHPLYHLGKSAKDLPVLAIDSFRHMYLFKHDVKQDLEQPGLLKQFVADLHSGKLHREFHHGPDPVKPAIESQDNKGEETAMPRDGEAKQPQPTTPPESSFKKLAPSKSRYTILRDEL
ncbi:hypothetical protein CAPTEDRAFT_163818 [Capitella teleta]|uniref:Thioredoxin domain-containing protein n=1 Tax=Capitella teleta TaxID=283909 RepID=R7TYJ0_CAPTE|nr:hypothetical protein CAPTEDRAFT_163818 [Capitella teleta]|eukprot:ELT96035.1 hypothetical protein CAPTEDRAFT_163818 [Capitella teleta]